jgi:methionine-rich copper-binding protein CopC
MLLALSLIWVVALCASALAHARLSEAEPAAGSTVEGSPEQVRLQFNEPVEAEFDPVKVLDSAGERVDEKNAHVAPEDVRVVEADLKELKEGAYRVEWRVTSVDGHVVADAYEFTVAAAAGESAVEDRERAGVAQQGEEQPADEQEPAAQEGAGGGSNPVATYTAVTFGIVLLAALAVLGVNLLRRKPRS